jgi:hypothetical protein
MVKRVSIIAYWGISASVFLHAVFVRNKYNLSHSNPVGQNMNTYDGYKYLLVKEIEGLPEYISEPPEHSYRNPRKRSDSSSPYNKNNISNPFRLEMLLLLV